MKGLQMIRAYKWIGHSIPRIVCAGIIITLLQGCPSARFNVTSAPAPPEHLGSFKMESATIPVVVQLTNFVIGNVDAQFSEEDNTKFRYHAGVAIPNMLQDFLGKRQVFSQVTRVSQVQPFTADYIVSGDYEFFQRLGTQGREWIPYAGAFGAKINTAWVKATLSVRIMEAKTGAEVFRKNYPEEHKEDTSIYQRVSVGYLQAAYMAGIASDIIGVIESREKQKPTIAPPPLAVSQQTERQTVALLRQEAHKAALGVVQLQHQYNAFRLFLQPNTSAERLNSVSAGTPLKVIEDKNQWLYIETPDERRGWILKEWVQQ
jgi:hypothetical protein